MSFGLVALAVVAVYVVWAFNRLIRLRQLAANAWADIDVQLKRRHDLIPQIVAVVKGHAGYERETLEAVVNARARALDASGPAARAAAEAPIAGSLHRIFALAEAYPDLMAMQSFRELQTTLSDVEDHLQNARRYYNAVVRDLNTALESFPGNLLAGPFGFSKREYFELDSTAERAAPQVSFS